MSQVLIILINYSLSSGERVEKRDKVSFPLSRRAAVMKAENLSPEPRMRVSKRIKKIQEHGHECK